jgi:predicted MFS family arabinose efflux permease
VPCATSTGWTKSSTDSESYALFGAGYIAYATFIVAYLRTNEGFDSGSITAFWAILGLAAVVAAFAWGPILGRLKGGWGASATIATVAAGAALPPRRSPPVRRCH